MSKKIQYSPNLSSLNHKTEYISDEQSYLTVKNNDGFYYGERKGIDSVAFVLFAINTDDDKRIGLVYELKPPLEHSLTGAFGGSIDDEKYYDDLRSLVKDEAMEEAGFDINVNDVKYYGKYYVSTQQNQFCYLFGVTVDKTKQQLRTTTNVRELESTIMWVSLPEVVHLKEWKAILICLNRFLDNQSVVTVTKN